MHNRLDRALPTLGAFSVDGVVNGMRSTLPLSGIHIRIPQLFRLPLNSVRPTPRVECFKLLVLLFRVAYPAMFLSQHQTTTSSQPRFAGVREQRGGSVRNIFLSNLRILHRINGQSGCSAMATTAKGVSLPREQQLRRSRLTFNHRVGRGRAPCF